MVAEAAHDRLSAIEHGRSIRRRVNLNPANRRNDNSRNFHPN
jgi:hypothetical protein